MNEELMNQIKELVKLVKNNALKKLNLKAQDLELEIVNSEIETPRLAYDPALPAQVLSCSSQDPASDKFFYISSPLVGTFYRAPAPSSPSFVEIGEEVEPRQTLCIIEAMKVMNEIVSEKKGRVLEFLVENGEMVDYGKALVKLELIEDMAV